MRPRSAHVIVAFAVGLGAGATLSDRLVGRTAEVSPIDGPPPPERYDFWNGTRWEHEALIVANRELRPILAADGRSSFRVTEVVFQGSVPHAGIVWWFLGDVDGHDLRGSLVHEVDSDTWRMTCVRIDQEPIDGYQELLAPSPTVWFGDDSPMK